MLKIRLMGLALAFAAISGTGAMAQGLETAAPVKEPTLTFEMLVSQYHFPVKKNTGNPEADHQAYSLAKGKWISENRELYRRFNEQGKVVSVAPRRKQQESFSPTK